MDQELKLELLDNNYESSRKELTDILKDLKKINEIQKDLALLVQEQDENINEIDVNTTETLQLAEKANSDLEISAGRKLKFAPLIIGAGIGVMVSLPITIPLATTNIIGGSAIGWSALGTGLFGGLLGKNLS